MKKRVPDIYLGAFKCGHRKVVREYIDDEFSYELYRRVERGDTKAKEALEWLAKYNNEAYKGFLKKGDPNAIHSTKTLYKQVNDAQNARRRDIIGAVRSGVMGPKASIVQLEDNTYQLENHLNQMRDLRHEDCLIELVGKKITHNIE